LFISLITIRYSSRRRRQKSQNVTWIYIRKKRYLLKHFTYYLFKAYIFGTFLANRLIQRKRFNHAHHVRDKKLRHHKKGPPLAGSQQIEYRFHDYRVDGLDRSLLDTFIAELGWEALLNTRGRRGASWMKRSAPVSITPTLRQN
jgi:hypothetical protein